MTSIATSMKGWVLTGHGGFDKLVWREDLPVPQPKAGDVLIRCTASSVNNTDINTRTAWYSKSVRAGTTNDGTGSEPNQATDDDGGWAGEPIRFPRIQGADCCGVVVAVGDGVSPLRVGERVLVRTMQPTDPSGKTLGLRTLGSECDGGFAEFLCITAHDALPIRSGWRDVELGTLPCAYSTAEGMLQRARIGAERVLITGASGGVGAAAIQLAKRRGAHITAMTSPTKFTAIKAIGADETVNRNASLGRDRFDAIIDLVGGPQWPMVLDSLRPGGRYVTAGAIAGPIVELDLRTLYLRDLTLFGSTYQPPNIMSDLIRYVERNEIKPLVAKTFPIRDLVEAQQTFLTKAHVGKIALRVDGT